MHAYSEMTIEDSYHITREIWAWSFSNTCLRAGVNSTSLDVEGLKNDCVDFFFIETIVIHPSLKRRTPASCRARH